MAHYQHQEIDAKWQKYWADNQTFKTSSDRSKPKYYVLDMFPYPSGSGLHVGHPKGYVATDVVARAKRMQGHNVLRVMGWDSFGLPAERQAVKEGKHPREITTRNVATFKNQLCSKPSGAPFSAKITEPAFKSWPSGTLTPFAAKMPSSTELCLLHCQRRCRGSAGMGDRLL